MKRIKTGNSAGILEAVWMDEGISRIELAKRLGIDKSTVSNLVGELVGRGLLEEYDQAEASVLGGRKPVKLRINKAYGTVVGIEVQPDFYRLVVLDLGGDQLLSTTGTAATQGHNLEDRVLAVLEEFRQKSPEVFSRCLGVGIAVSGVVDPFAGTVVESTSLGIAGLALLPRLRDRLAVPVFLENDANAACWGEVVLGRDLGHPLRSFLFCLVEYHEKQLPVVETGASVGLGFVLNGQIHYGENYSAGEFRSLGWSPGNTFQFSLNDEEMARLRTSREVRVRFARELAGHLLFLSRVFNLNQICFGGEVDPMRADLEAAVAEAQGRFWPGGNCPCRVRFSAHGPDAVAYGAACLGLTGFFRNPGPPDRLAVGGVFR